MLPPTYYSFSMSCMEKLESESGGIVFRRMLQFSSGMIFLIVFL